MARLRTGSTLRAVLAGCLALLAISGTLTAQEATEDAPLLELESILVEPPDPAPDTLCTLTVKIRNNGTETASQFGFSVALNGQDLSVYGNQLFMYAIEPGESLEFPLYNFWTTETSRPTAPPDGKLLLEVAIKESQWMKIEMEDEVEVWTPLGPVEGLPAANALTLTMSSGS